MYISLQQSRRNFFASFIKDDFCQCRFAVAVIINILFFTINNNSKIILIFLLNALTNFKLEK